MGNTKQYCGKAKRRSSQFGEFFNITLSPSDVETIIAARGADGWLHLQMGETRQPDKRGNTHTIWVDDWKPNGQQANASAPRPTGVDPDYGPPVSGGYDNGGFGETPTPAAPPTRPDGIPF